MQHCTDERHLRTGPNADLRCLYIWLAHDFAFDRHVPQQQADMTAGWGQAIPHVHWSWALCFL